MNIGHITSLTANHFSPVSLYVLHTGSILKNWKILVTPLLKQILSRTSVAFLYWLQKMAMGFQPHKTAFSPPLQYLFFMSPFTPRFLLSIPLGDVGKELAAGAGCSALEGRVWFQGHWIESGPCVSALPPRPPTLSPRFAFTCPSFVP